MGLFGGGGAAAATTENVLHVYQQTPQTLNNGDNDIIYDIAVVDPSNQYDDSTGIFTISKTGTYLVQAGLNADGGSAGDIYDIKLADSANVTLASINGSSTYADSGGTGRFAGLGTAFLTSGQDVKIVIYYAGGDNPTTNTAGPEFNVWKLFKLP